MAQLGSARPAQHMHCSLLQLLLEEVRFRGLMHVANYRAVICGVVCGCLLASQPADRVACMTSSETTTCCLWSWSCSSFK